MNFVRSCTVGLLAASVCFPAIANDVSYADRQGNLVIESDAGYKRIIVGQGHNASALSGYLEQSHVEANGDRSFADSQGNVTVIAASGAKRILVGRAEEFAGDGDVQVIEAPDAFQSGYAARSNPVVCAPADGVIKGRSYMYGLKKGATPVIVNCQ